MKKALSALLAAVMVLGLAALAPITAHAATLTANDAASLATALAAAGDNTIRLTADITYNNRIEISTAKIITFDLNGKTLTLRHIIRLFGGAKIQLLNPANGEFNVYYYSDGDVIEVFGGSSLEVTNVEGGDWAMNAVGGEITVYGDVTSMNEGACASGGGKITINGTITTIAPASDYIKVGSTAKTAAQFLTPSTKTGYLTYSFTDSYGTNTVWVKCAAHTFGDWTVDTPATATATGTKHRNCTACNFREDGTIPATGGGGDDPGDCFVLWGKTTTYLKSNFWNWILLIFLFGWIWMAF
ncbi:MAG: hypothetical protein FWF60_01115 [Oscillospiraceae bacterium]|nr:hypothetical protein [Oscillospiraceae bacterium]